MNSNGAIGTSHQVSGSHSCVVGTGTKVSSSGSFVYCDASPDISPGGGAWSCSSSRDVKTSFADVDTPSVLAKVIALPMTTWQFLGERSGARHLGPMAQDFHAAFGLGDDDRSITTVDASGVALAAIQGLNAKLEAQIAERDAQIAELRRLVEVLLARTSPEGRVAAR